MNAPRLAARIVVTLEAFREGNQTRVGAAEPEF
jgi:hypothetical protein